MQRRKGDFLRCQKGRSGEEDSPDAEEGEEEEATEEDEELPMEAPPEVNPAMQAGLRSTLRSEIKPRGKNAAAGKRGRSRSAKDPEAKAKAKAKGRAKAKAKAKSKAKAKAKAKAKGKAAAREADGDGTDEPVASDGKPGKMNKGGIQRKAPVLEDGTVLSLGCSSCRFALRGCPTCEKPTFRGKRRADVSPETIRKARVVVKPKQEDEE